MPSPKGGYRTKDGSRVPGTTTILGRFKESEGITYWAWNLAYAPLMQARAILQTAWDTGEDYSPNNQTLKDFLALNPDGFDYKKVRETAADAGTCAHEMFDCWTKGIPFDLDNHYPPAIKALAEPAFQAGKEWAANSRFSVVESEVSLVSERYRFGGTRDGILINGKRAIADVKTSNAIYPDYLLQLAAYAILDEEQGNTIDGGYHLLKFSKQTLPTDPIRFAHFWWDQLDLAKKAFLLMRELYDDMKALEKMVK